MSRTPIVRPVSLLNAAVNVGVLAGCVGLGAYSLGRHGAIIGCGGYLFVSLLLKSLIARDHRRAISLCKRQQYALAIPEFQRSLAFFDRFPWIDRWRAVTMLSAAGMCYREMAMVSIGFCYAQIGDGAQSRHYYEQALREFPGNGMAEAALRLLDAGRQSADIK